MGALPGKAERACSVRAWLSPLILTLQRHLGVDAISWASYAPRKPLATERSPRVLPVCRTPDDVDTMPPFEVTCEDVEGCLDELHAFHALFRDCFVRRAPREHFVRSMVGQCSTIERTALEPIAVQTDASSSRAMPRGLSDVEWQDAHMLQTYHQQVANEMGTPEGGMIVAESGLVKKGQDSVGVARPYGGTLGKVDHGQGGGCAASAARQGDALVDTRLFLPEQWLSDA